MERRRMIVDNKEKGIIRFKLYKEVMSRLDFAIKEGFYLEAITLLESIITDKLESRYCYLKKTSKGFHDLGNLKKNYLK
ncbi:MAG: hypothetical protein PHW02_03980 [bacterium]|nr:hypothetical protein [bacterium]